MCYSWLQVRHDVCTAFQKRNVAERWMDFIFGDLPWLVPRQSSHVQLCVAESSPSVLKNSENQKQQLHWYWPELGMISFTDLRSNRFITYCSLRANSDPRPSRAQSTLGKWTKLSHRAKTGRFIVFRFRCGLKEHEANRLPGHAQTQICLSQGVQGVFILDIKRYYTKGKIIEKTINGYEWFKNVIIKKGKRKDLVE